MKITICELPNSEPHLGSSICELQEHAKAETPDLVVLPEMPFHRWLPAQKDYSNVAWLESVDAHNSQIENLHRSKFPPFVSSRPCASANGNRNTAFLAQSGDVRDIRSKHYVPSEIGFWESNWYRAGPREFPSVSVGGLTIGVMICTEMWFMHHGRQYGQDGCHLIVVPRATKSNTIDKWLTGARALAIISGCYVLSSNLGKPHESHADLGGAGFGIDPDGKVLAVTDSENRFIDITIDASVANSAKKTYPRNVRP